ncbi:MAG: hypothetical protein M0Z66_02010 [Thermaerobacter sp.]|nr:hypothetical protein [Thermaerobacter sp.]
MPETAEDPVKLLASLFANALKALASKGANEEACTLAARAWSGLKETRPIEAEKMNGLLHLLTHTQHHG